MLLIVGLGNPGEELRNTRHNIGRETLEALHKKTGSGRFRFEKKWNADIAETKIGKEKVMLALPDTFMNKSGEVIGPIARFYKIKPEHIFLIHDDADLPLGRAKLAFGKNSAGHKGVESVIRALKTKDFWRFRIGIAGKRDMPAEKIVLKKFTTEEQKVVKKIITKTIEAISVSAEKNPEIAMNSYNQ